MLTEFTRSELGPNTTLYYLNTDRYRTNTVRFYFKQELKPRYNAMTALATRLLKHGSSCYPSRLELTRQLETLYGAQLATGVGKVGGHQLINVCLEVPAERFLPGARDVFAQALHAALNVMTEPAALTGTMDEDILALEKEYLSQEIRSLVDDKARYSLFRCNQEMYEEAPHALTETGTMEDLGRIQGSELPAHYHRMLAAADLNIFMVGRFSPGDMEAIEKLAALRNEGAVPEAVTPPPVRQEPKETLEEADVSQARICRALRAPSLAGTDYYSLVMYNGVLGGFPHSKLFVNVREKAHLAYDVWSFVSSVPPVQYIIAGVHSDTYRQALEIMEEQRQDILTGNISRAEMDATRKGVVNRMRGVDDTPERLIGQTISDLLAGRKASIDEQIEAFERVEPQDMVDIAKKLQLDTTLVLLPRRCEQPS